MSAIATVLLERGYQVAGSDISQNENTRRISALGIKTYIGHSADNISRFAPDVCVYSLSINESNPEYAYAISNAIPALSRAAFISLLYEGYDTRIGISGSHGKSTVCAMVYSALMSSGLPTDLLFGADYMGKGAYIGGGGNTVVLEACEYGNSFLELSPDVCVLLNLEYDHADYFKNIDDVEQSFYKFAECARRFAVVCYDDARLMSIAARLRVPTLTFGRGKGADVRYASDTVGAKRRVTLYYKEEKIGEVLPSVIGEHNAANIAAAASVCIGLGRIGKSAIRSLAEFSGIGRRLEQIGHIGSISVLYDYAHHPTEIRATIKALRDDGRGGIAIIFVPHTYSRTIALLDDFASALSCADEVYIADIYAAREKDDGSVTPQMLVNRIIDNKGRAFYLAAGEAEKTVDTDEMTARGIRSLVIMGAGDADEFISWAKGKMKTE